MIENNQSNHEGKSPGVTPNQAGLYQKIASKSDKIITKLFELLESRNESVALGAANTLIDKILPSLKATEHKGEGGGPILIKIISEENGNRTTDQELPKATVNL